MKLTDEKISQSADLKAVHRVYLKQCMIGTGITDTHVDVSPCIIRYSHNKPTGFWVEQHLKGWLVKEDRVSRDGTCCIKLNCVDHRMDG